MRLFGRSKKKEAPKAVPSTYTPPDVNEMDDSSDEEMVVLDYSISGDREAAASNHQNQEKKAASGPKKETDTVLSGKQPKGPSAIASPSVAHKDVKSVQDPDKKEIPYQGSEMEAERIAVDKDISKSKQLEKLRSRAEDGPMVIRYFCICAVTAMYLTSVLVVYDQYLSEGLNWTTISHGMTAVASWIMGALYLVCEVRSPDPKSFSTSARLFVTKHLSFMRLLWGRGLFLFSLGLLHASHSALETTIIGSILIFVGLVAFCIGRNPARMIEGIRHHKMDDAILFIDFRKFDYDQDGFLDIDGFMAIVSELDLDMDTFHNIREFNSIDSNRDGKISFEEFKKWKKEEAWSYERSGCGHFCGVGA